MYLFRRTKTSGELRAGGLTGDEAYPRKGFLPSFDEVKQAKRRADLAAARREWIAETKCLAKARRKAGASAASVNRFIRRRLAKVFA